MTIDINKPTARPSIINHSDNAKINLHNLLPKSIL